MATAIANANTITIEVISEELLRELAETRSDQETVLSVYLDLDPTEFALPRDRASEVTALLDDAHRIVEQRERPITERESLRTALERTRAELEGDQPWASGARGLALFVDELLGLWRLVRLSHPVAPQVAVARTPLIAPLLQAGQAVRLCVALVDERSARLLHGSHDDLEELISFGDPVHGRHEQGGWSQANYQRSRTEDIKAHLRHVARELHRELKRAPFDRLLLAATEPLWPRLRDELHPDLRARLGPRVTLDASDPTAADIQAAVAPILAAERDAREEEALTVLRQRLAAEGAAAGVTQVLAALEQRRVRTLFYDTGQVMPGVECPRCGWLGASGDSCPLDGSRLEQLADVLAPALRRAVAQDAEVRALTDRPNLGPIGHIAAILRF